MTSRSSSRERKLTERGLEYQISLQTSKFRSAVSAWKSVANKLQVLMSDNGNPLTIRQERDKLQENFQTLSNIDSNLKSLVSGEQTQTNEYVNIETSNHKLMGDIGDYIRSVETERSVVNSQSSRSCRSQSRHSVRSRHSQCSNRSEVAAHAAALKAKLKYIDIEAKTKAELERIQTQREIDIAEAKIEALDSTNPFMPNTSLSTETSVLDRVNDYLDAHTHLYHSNENREISAQPLENSKACAQIHTVKEEFTDPVTPAAIPCPASLDPSVPDFVPLRPVHLDSRNVNSLDVAVNTTNSDNFSSFAPNSVAVPMASNYQLSKVSSDQGLIDLARSLAEQVSLNRLPSPEPGMFYGDPIQYPSWKLAFKTLVESRHIPDAEKIHYLKKYIGGPVKQVIENYLLLASDDAYDKARKLLDERYGDPFTVANAFRAKLDSWPKLSPKDASSLLKFSDFLKQCLTAMQTISHLSVLNDAVENRKMLAKLPEWLVSRWNRLVVAHKESHNEFPPFEAFEAFIAKEAKIACNPITSVQSIKGDVSHHDKEGFEKPKRFSYKGRSLFTGTSENKYFSNDTPNRNKSDIQCLFCSRSGHELDLCKNYLSKTLEERKAFAGDKKLCFGCLSPGHLSRGCKRRKQCKTCSKFHPTSLHGDKVPIKSSASQGNSHKDQATKTDVSEMTQGNTSKKQMTKSEVSERAQAMLSDSSCLSSRSSSNKCSMVVPVFLSQRDNPNMERLVYAMLDSQSDTTFILNDTCDALGLVGPKVTLLLSTMSHKDIKVESSKIGGLVIRGFDSTVKIHLPDTFTREVIPANRAHIPSPEMAKHWPHLKGIADKLMPVADCEVGLLVGYNCARALMPREVIPPIDQGPFGQRTDLGWGIVGIVGQSDLSNDQNDCIGLSHRICTLEIPIALVPKTEQHGCRNEVTYSFKSRVKVASPVEIAKATELDICDNLITCTQISQEDRIFLEKMTSGIKFVDGHYSMPLPFKDDKPNLPNNRSMALRRLEGLKKRFQRDNEYRKLYEQFISNLIKSGHAEVMSDPDLQVTGGHEWYIPHHGVFHPKKPGKLRVVFDCSAVHDGQSLNGHLLQGPDMTNTLIGVLSRFRLEKIAFVCDIEQMFHQFRVDEEYRNYLRFLWWSDSSFSKVVVYRMCVHLFGASSSPGCANFGLKQIAKDNEAEFGEDVANFLRFNFYVDDGLKSVSSVEEAIHTIDSSQAMCRKGGVRLHKFSSNSREVLSHVLPEDRASGLENIEICNDGLHVERTLGVQWCIESDSFQFRIVLSDKPLTRRGVLSTVSSVYDPLGFISPVILVGKQILQQLCAQNADWDDPIPEVLKLKWEQWRNELSILGSLKISRCFKPKAFGEVTTVEIHHFSDASTEGYGQCSYLRLVDNKEHVHCSLLMSKSKVAPVKFVTIPRLELAAAVVSVKISALLQQELQFPNAQEYFWTDSKVVIGYIRNDARRFHIFVANRVQQIRSHTSPSQWRYVESGLNPADSASRGISANTLVYKSNWFRGPDFLWDTKLPPNEDVIPPVADDDKEQRKVQVLDTFASPASTKEICSRFDYFSSWKRLKSAIVMCRRYITFLKRRILDRSTKPIQPKVQMAPEKSYGSVVSVRDLVLAEQIIVKAVQADAFCREIEALNNLHISEKASSQEALKLRKYALKGNSPIFRLDPFLDEFGLLRVGGRMKRAEVTFSFKHPVILPRRGHVTQLIIRHFHESVHHQGRGITVNEIRSNGFWIVNLNSSVSSFISGCVVCKRLRGTLQVQKMADLPIDRLEPAPPFTYSGVDYFGPWYVREGRKELKRYGAIFTCLLCRAVHIEVAASLDTDSFINALRRFLSVRGPIRVLRSDRGTNFIGAARELREAVSEMDDNRVCQYLLENGCDYAVFKTNVPSASHMGGVWERQIRSVRNVLNALMYQHGSQIDDEGLRTFMCEAAAVVNSRPLTVENLNDPLSLEPLTPNHLLTMKTKIVLPPPGEFQKSDLYSRKRWRRVQYLADEFWSRWRKEFLQNLQARSKWVRPEQNLSIGDIVLVKDDNVPRYQWSLGRVMQAEPDEDGHVRKVTVAIGDSNIDKNGKRNKPLSLLERPIHKLVLLCESG